MKKIFTLIIVTLISISAVSAQKLISFGPRAAMNTTFNVSKGLVVTQGEVGWKFGATMEVRPLKFLGVSLDIMYSSVGFKREFENGSFSYNLGYLDVPILLNVYVWRGLAIKAGIQPSIKLNGSVGVSGIEDPDIINTLNSNIKSGKFDVPVGIGYTFGIGLAVDVRYNIGTTNVTNGTQYNSDTFELGIAWKF